LPLQRVETAGVGIAGFNSTLCEPPTNGRLPCLPLVDALDYDHLKQVSEERQFGPVGEAA
jgi:hypothetical protein